MRTIFQLFAALVCTSTVNAAAILTATDFIIGGRIDATVFMGGAAGGDGGATVYDDNVWPGEETPDHAIDGVGQKYLNFAELNTGFIVTPSFNGGLGSNVTSIQLWTANDEEGRDPASYQLYGTNAVIIDFGPFPLSAFTLISSGPLALPAGRNPGGAVALNDSLSQTVAFANGGIYKSYLLVFPTVKNEPGVNSMQIAEVQFFGNVPEPSSLSSSVVGLMAIAFTVRPKRTLKHNSKV